jgi:hypothetical protein
LEERLVAVARMGRHRHVLLSQRGVHPMLKRLVAPRDRSTAAAAGAFLRVKSGSVGRLLTCGVARAHPVDTSDGGGNCTRAGRSDSA